jgi:hypothetical protein
VYEWVIGFPRIVGGVWVWRQTDWHVLSIVLPIPIFRASTSYYYTNIEGKRVRHGRYVACDRAECESGTFLDGARDGEWIVRDAGGAVSRCRMYKKGELVSLCGS